MRCHARRTSRPLTSPGLDPGVLFPDHEKDARIKSAQGEWGENASPHHPISPTCVGARGEGGNKILLDFTPMICYISAHSPQLGSCS